MSGKLFIHLPASMLERHSEGEFGLYKRLLSYFKSRGIQVEIVERPSTTELSQLSKGAFHLVHHGRIKHPNVLNCGIAYFPDYWYVDPQGVLCDSSLGLKNPDYSTIETDKAQAFFYKLRKEYLETGVSKYAQPIRCESFGKGHIVVFLQGMSDPVARNMHMTEFEMLNLLVKQCSDRPILVKPHPKKENAASVMYAHAMAKKEPRLRVVTANVHDLLKDAYCSVSICSGASFEGFLHRTPAILFGRSDFGACSLTVQTEEELIHALKKVENCKFQYELFLFWFLKRRTFYVHDDNLPLRILRRISRTGFRLEPQEFC